MHFKQRASSTVCLNWTAYVTGISKGLDHRQHPLTHTHTHTNTHKSASQAFSKVWTTGSTHSLTHTHTHTNTNLRHRHFQRSGLPAAPTHSHTHTNTNLCHRHFQRSGPSAAPTHSHTHTHTHTPAHFWYVSPACPPHVCHTQVWTTGSTHTHTHTQTHTCTFLVRVPCTPTARVPHPGLDHRQHPTHQGLHPATAPAAATDMQVCGWERGCVVATKGACQTCCATTLVPTTCSPGCCDRVSSCCGAAGLLRGKSSGGAGRKGGCRRGGSACRSG